MFFSTTKAKLKAIVGTFFEQMPNFTAPIITEDTNVYFVSVKREVGLFGWRYRTKHKPVCLPRKGSAYYFDQDVQYLTDLRRSTEARYYIGDRTYLMLQLDFLEHDDFDATNSVELLRAKDANAYIEDLIDNIPHPVHVFTTWLRAQIDAGLTELNGVMLRDCSTTLGVGRLATRQTERFKECEPEDYLKVYQQILRRQYDAMPLSAELEARGGYVLPTLDDLAKQFLKEQTSSYLGLGMVVQQNDARRMAIELYNRKVSDSDIKPVLQAVRHNAAEI